MYVHCIVVPYESCYITTPCYHYMVIFHCYIAVAFFYLFIFQCFLFNKLQFLSHTTLCPDDKYTDSIHNNDILIPGYLPPLRRDRNRHEGGVTVYIGDTLNAKRCPLLEPDSGEFICIDLYYNFSHYMICFFYRPPNTSVADFTDGISFILSRAEAAAFSNFFFLGDSNSKHKAWFHLIIRVLLAKI